MWSPLRRLWIVVRRSRLDDDLRDEFETHLALIEDEERGATASTRGRRATTRECASATRSRTRKQSLDGVVAKMARRRVERRAVRAQAVAQGAGLHRRRRSQPRAQLGANAAIFTLISTPSFSNSLPVSADPGALVLVGHARARGVGTAQRGSYSTSSVQNLYTHLRDTDVFDRVCAVQSSEDRVALRIGDARTAEPATARFVSGNYFHVLSADAALGRTLTPKTTRPLRVRRLSSSFRYRFARTRSTENPATIGSTIFMNGVPVTIVGVAPAEFYGRNH